MKKVCVFIGSRANYSSIKSAMKSIKKHDELELQIIIGASAVLDRYGLVGDLIKQDGFRVDAELFMLVEGESPATMAKSTGLGLIEIPTVFERLKPDFVVTIGDRFETMATTLAAAYMNIPIAHTMGGEISGTIDESIRHAVTKFAHVHFPASKGAAERIRKLGELEENIHLVGCPRIDLVAEIVQNDQGTKELSQNIFQTGVGIPIDLNKPFLLVSQHPVTTEYGFEERQIQETLKAVEEVDLPTIMLWPNSDAGSDDIARGIRKWREEGRDKNMFFSKNLPVDVYIRLMKRTACLIGNSSSGIREGAYIGTPTVNVGSRQKNRERGANVIDVKNDFEAIKLAVNSQISHGKYEMDSLYGDGNAGDRIANILAKKTVTVQKCITF